MHSLLSRQHLHAPHEALLLTRRLHTAHVERRDRRVMLPTPFGLGGALGRASPHAARHRRVGLRCGYAFVPCCRTSGVVMRGCAGDGAGAVVAVAWRATEDDGWPWMMTVSITMD